MNIPARNRIDTAQELRYAKDIDLNPEDDSYEKQMVQGSALFESPEQHELARVGVPGEPGSESAGPSLFDLVRETRHAQQVSAELLREAAQMLAKRTVVESGQAQTDGNGNLDVVMFRVPQGYEFLVERCNVEAAGFSPGAGFASGASWIAMIVGDRFVQGSMLDFLPSPPANAGVILPCVLTNQGNESGTLKGGQMVSLHITGAAGLANTMITFRLQGKTRPI